MAARPWTPAEEQLLRDGHAAGRTLTAIADELQRAKSSVSDRAKALGLTWDTSQVEAATRSRKAVCAELRAQLEEDYLREAAELLKELRQPCLVYSFGGRDNTYEQREHDQPDAQSKLKLVQASGAALDRALKIDAHVNTGSADGVRSMLGQLGQALGLTQAEPPEPADG